MSDKIHRVVIIFPANRVAAFNAWFRQNIDNRVKDNVTVGLNGTGSSAQPATHYWCCGSFNESDLVKLLDRLTSQTGISRPGSWNQMSRTEKKTWLTNIRNGVFTAIGVRIFYIENDAKNWDDQMSLLNGTGLKPING